MSTNFFADFDPFKPASYGLDLLNAFTKKDESRNDAFSKKELEDFSNKLNNDPVSKFNLGDKEYVSNYAGLIAAYMMRQDVYLEAPPGSGKTEMAKLLFFHFEKCGIILPQTNIRDAKFREDAELSRYVIETADVDNLTEMPTHFICIWDTYVKLIKRFGMDPDCYCIFDETHNFVTQFHFRPIVAELMDFFSKHVLFMTGTKAGEECILRAPYKTLHFWKENPIFYTCRPIILPQSSKAQFKKSVLQFIKNNEDKHNCVVVYDNVEHGYWAENLGDCVHYASPYYNTDEVQEVNVTKRSRHKKFAATMFLDQGVDIKGYRYVLIVVPMYNSNIDATKKNLAPHKLNLLQLAKRFRDADKVEIVFIQNGFDKAQNEPETISFKAQQYIDALCSGESRRNDAYDAMLHIEKFDDYTIKRIFAKGTPEHELYTLNCEYLHQSFTLSDISQLDMDVEYQYTAPIAEPFLADGKIRITSSQQDEIYEVNQRIEHYAKKVSGGHYLDAIQEIEKSIGHQSVNRTMLTRILAIASKAQKALCLGDCVKKFKFNWNKIDRFLTCMDLQVDILSGKKVLYNNRKSNIFLEQDERTYNEIQSYLKELNFTLFPKHSFADRVENFRILSPNGSSIFRTKEHYIPNRSQKAIFVNRNTGEQQEFDSIKEGLYQLSIPKKIYYRHKKDNFRKPFGEWYLVTSIHQSIVRPLFDDAA